MSRDMAFGEAYPSEVDSVHIRVKSSCSVIYALVLHDIKNRFFGSGLGQIVMILWPFVHIIVLVAIYNFSNRPHPYGESSVQYSAISIYPFIIFNYVSRWIVYSAVTNRSFLNYPIIKPLDILIARALLEIISIIMVGILLVAFIWCLGDDVMPNSPMDAALAALCTLFLAIGMGFLNAPFAFMLPIWNLVMALLIILAWISSGVAFTVSSLPEQIRVPLSYNPLLQCTEWMRTAYFMDYDSSVLDRWYVAQCALCFLTAGFVLHRIFRRFY